VYYVTFYHADPHADPSTMDRLREVYPRHRAYLDEFAKGGQVWMIGTFGDPATQGSMAIFRSKDAAETFYESDPFNLEGLVHRFELREWNPLEFPANAQAGS
jgi:uncharacterized protein YciI